MIWNNPLQFPSRLPMVVQSGNTPNSGLFADKYEMTTLLRKSVNHWKKRCNLGNTNPIDAQGISKTKKNRKQKPPKDETDAPKKTRKSRKKESSGGGSFWNKTIKLVM